MFGRIIGTLTALAVLAIGAHGAQAAVTTYTDRTTFGTASGSTATETFGSATAGLYSSTYSVSYAGFTVSGTTNGNNVGISTGSLASSGDDHPIPTSFTGQNFLGWGNNAGSSIGVMTFTFAAPVTAFGFDWFNTDYTDQYGVNVNGTTYTAPPFTQASGATSTSGFFGVVSTTALTSFSISAQFYGGYVSTEGLDNVTYSAAPAAVPEPASMALLGMGVLGMAAARRRRAR